MPLTRKLLLVACLALSLPALAQGAAAPAAQAPAAAPAAPTSTFQSDVVGVLGHVQEELVGLEQAMPQSKFTWHPAKGVRSVAEVYLHAAGSSYFFGKMLGIEVPADIAAQMKTFEKSTTDKAKIQKALIDSFTWFGNGVKQMPDAELSKTLDVFGHTMSKRALVMIALGHYQEHLGQSIAYARSNGVTPPWSKKGD
ncbi:MAG TPA: DinB family protein [Myxococcaceae bacterium]|nr:DinB family protein [Myxococcaceae bacterium]